MRLKLSPGNYPKYKPHFYKVRRLRYGFWCFSQKELEIQIEKLIRRNMVEMLIEINSIEKLSLSNILRNTTNQKYSIFDISVSKDICKT